MQVIGLCGYAGSGKDTAAQGLIELGWQRVSFADPIREMALAIDPWIEPWNNSGRLSNIVREYGWEVAKNSFPEVRRLLQRIGTEAGRDILGQDVWLDVAERKMIQAECDQCPGVVITDMRFENERIMLGDWKATFVRISRPGVGPVNEHQSDQLLASFEVDHEIVNDGDEAKLQAALVAVAKGACHV